MNLGVSIKLIFKVLTVLALPHVFDPSYRKYVARKRNRIHYDCVYIFRWIHSFWYYMIWCDRDNEDFNGRTIFYWLFYNKSRNSKQIKSPHFGFKYRNLIFTVKSEQILLLFNEVQYLDVIYHKNYTYFNFCFVVHKKKIRIRLNSSPTQTDSKIEIFQWFVQEICRIIKMAILWLTAVSPSKLKSKFYVYEIKHITLDNNNNMVFI